ncbi:hypothetical protein [Succinimonas sp.]|uniref:hypothetical protein n=1 Tax=Succinimonas sp. TaxID=1936151 RepID=UPI003863C52B
MELHVDLRTTVLSVIGGVFCYLLIWKLLFLFFSVSESFLMILISCIIGAFLLAAYGIQRVEWSVDSSWSIFGIILRSETTVYYQYKLFGIYGISEPEIASRNIVYLENFPVREFLNLVFSMKSMLPFGGYLPDITFKKDR